MKNKIIIIFLLASVTGMLNACREDAPQLDNPRYTLYMNSWEKTFDTFWNAMNNNYVFWSVDPTDWDAVYDKYMPLFQELDENPAEDMDAFAEQFSQVEEYFKEMTADLIDGHYNLQVTVNSAEGLEFTISPSSAKQTEREGYMENRILAFYAGWTLANKNMIADGSLTEWLSYVPQDLVEGYVWGSGLLEGDIAYLRISTYAPSITSHIGTGDEADDLMQQYFGYIDNKEDLAGVIIDVRGNYGGAVADLKTVLNRLVNEETVFAYQREKDGPGRLDYTPWIPQILVPSEEKVRNLNVPVVVLADMNSVSMAEHTTFAVKAMPNGTFIGERTFGGHGTYSADNNAFYTSHGGYVSNYMFTMVTTSTMTKFIDGNVYEGVGIPPDIECPFDYEGFLQGIDTQLERAITFIQTGM